MSSRRSIGIALAVALLTAGALLVTMRSRGRSVDTPPAVGDATRQPKALPKLAVKGAELEEKGPDGQVKWRVTAGGELQYDKDGDLVIGNNVEFVIVQKQLTPLKVTAQRFTADYRKRKLTFEQGVQGRFTGNAGSFAVGRLEYQFSTGKLIGTGGASFVRGPYRATGQQLVVDTAAQRVRLRGDVRFAATG
ncbi:MAG: hypothetical protein HPY69_09410 [Armatimonadetes bacterium]|nr:hypothetical protein [Armatimonadota bacterium]